MEMDFSPYFVVFCVIVFVFEGIRSVFIFVHAKILRLNAVVTSTERTLPF
jgi:hypothetical protein